MIGQHLGYQAVAPQFSGLCRVQPGPLVASQPFPGAPVAYFSDGKAGRHCYLGIILALILDYGAGAPRRGPAVCKGDEAASLQILCTTPYTAMVDALEHG